MFLRTTGWAALVGSVALTAALVSASPASARTPRAAFPATLAGAPLFEPIANIVNGPTVLGPMSCDPGNPGAARPASRYVGSYWDGTNDLDRLTADAVITTWRDSRAAFKDVLDDTGLCTFVDSTRIDWPGTDPATHALFDNGMSVSAVIRDGRRIVAVDVADWNCDDEPGDPDQRSEAIAGALRSVARL